MEKELDRYYAKMQDGTNSIEWKCANRKPNKKITIWEKIEELRTENNKKIFISFYNPKTRESTKFTDIKDLNDIENITEIFEEYIKWALIFDNEDWTYYDIAIKKPFR